MAAPQFTRQDYRNLLVQMAYWADIEKDIQISNKALAQDIAKALRVEAMWDEFDAGSGLPLGDAQDIMGADWVSPEVDVVGFYSLVFDRGDALLVQRLMVDRTLGGAVARYAPPSYGIFEQVSFSLDGVGLRLGGEVCRRPTTISTPRPPGAPKVRRGAHWMTPIEARFYDELKETGLVFAAQVPVEGPGGDYRPDFVVFYQGGALAVELDGHESHKTKPQRQRDARKDRRLQLNGFRTARWTGSDVHRDAPACVRELVELVRRLQG